MFIGDIQIYKLSIKKRAHYEKGLLYKIHNLFGFWSFMLDFGIKNPSLFHLFQNSMILVCKSYPLYIIDCVEAAYVWLPLISYDFIRILCI